QRTTFTAHWAERRLSMLERYFIRPQTVDQIRASWIGQPIERYVAWLTEEGYASRNVFHRVPVLRHVTVRRTACRVRRRPDAGSSPRGGEPCEGGEGRDRT